MSTWPRRWSGWASGGDSGPGHSPGPAVKFDAKGRGGAVLLLLAVLAAALSACATREPRPAGDWLAERVALFESHPVWSVSGRLGLSDGERGGSLAFDWQARGEHHRVGLRTLAGGRQWRLEFGPGYAVLEGTDIDTLEGPDPDPLVEQAVGWPIPVAWMSRWLRGLPAPPDASLRFHDDGTLAGLVHEDWSLEIRRFTTLDNGVLAPARMQAENPPYRVRAALSGWRLAPDAGASSGDEPL